MTVYRVRLQMEWGSTGINLENVYHYEKAAEGSPDQASADELASWFDLTFLPIQAQIQTDQVKFQNILVQDIDVTVESVRIPATAQGQVLLDPMPQWAALSFVLRGTTKVTRPGGKRLAGVPEANFNSTGQISVPAYETNVNTYASALTSTPGAGWEAVIYGGPTESNPTRSVTNVISLGQFRQASTQNTRKRY